MCEFANEVEHSVFRCHGQILIQNCTNGVKRQARNFYAWANLLIRNFRYYTDNVKCYLFQSYCRIMYCCQLWFKPTKSSMKKLRTSYNSALRRFLTIPKL